MFKHRLKSLVLGAALLAGAFVSAQAQSPSIINPPYNTDMGPVITNSARVPGTVSSSQYSNLNWRGVVCKFVETASSGSPSTVFNIQAYDTATNTYANIGVSGAATGAAANTSGQTVLVYPGATLTTVPTGWVLNAVHLPRFWRVQQVIGGTGTTTSKIGCNYLN